MSKKAPSGPYPQAAGEPRPGEGPHEESKGNSHGIVDPDPSKFGTPEHFLSRKTIHEYARESGFAVVRVEDAFLKSHMIIVLQPVPLK